MWWEGKMHALLEELENDNAVGGRQHIDPQFPMCLLPIPIFIFTHLCTCVMYFIIKSESHYIHVSLLLTLNCPKTLYENNSVYVFIFHTWIYLLCSEELVQLTSRLKAVEPFKIPNSPGVIDHTCICTCICTYM